MNNYICENCGQTKEKGRTDEEAKAESQAQWGDLPEEDLAVVCDDCYKKMVDWQEQEVQRAVNLEIATQLEDCALTTESPVLLAAALALREGRDPSEAMKKQIIETVIVDFVKSATFAIDWNCLCSSRTGRPYKARIMKKKLSRLGL